MTTAIKTRESGKFKAGAVKIVAVWLGFLVLHYAYDFFPSGITRYFSAVSESIFQHMKIGFWAYTAVSGVEFWAAHRRGVRLAQFLPPRLLGIQVFLWAMLIFFYISPALLGAPMPSIFLEIVNANIVLVLSIYAGVVLEQDGSAAALSKTGVIILGAMYLLLLLEFSVFTFRLPWADLFAVPPGF